MAFNRATFVYTLYLYIYNVRMGVCCCTSSRLQYPCTLTRQTFQKFIFKNTNKAIEP